MRIGLVAKGLLIKDDMDLELVLMCKEKPTKTLLCIVKDNLPAQIQVSSFGAVLPQWLIALRGLFGERLAFVPARKTSDIKEYTLNLGQHLGHVTCLMW